jgi:hypothetical protein
MKSFTLDQGRQVCRRCGKAFYVEVIVKEDRRDISAVGEALHIALASREQTDLRLQLENARPRPQLFPG